MGTKVLAPYGHVDDLEKPTPLDANLAVLQDSVLVRWRCFKDRNAVTWGRLKQKLERKGAPRQTRLAELCPGPPLASRMKPRRCESMPLWECSARCCTAQSTLHPVLDQISRFGHIPRASRLSAVYIENCG